jgi:hypothetical protein
VRPRCLCGKSLSGFCTTESQRSHRNTENAFEVVTAYNTYRAGQINHNASGHHSRLIGPRYSRGFLQQFALQGKASKRNDGDAGIGRQPKRGFAFFSRFTFAD